MPPFAAAGSAIGIDWTVEGGEEEGGGGVDVRDGPGVLAAARREDAMTAATSFPPLPSILPVLCMVRALDLPPPRPRSQPDQQPSTNPLASRLTSHSPAPWKPGWGCRDNHHSKPMSQSATYLFLCRSFALPARIQSEAAGSSMPAESRDRKFPAKHAALCNDTHCSSALWLPDQGHPPVSRSISKTSPATGPEPIYATDLQSASRGRLTCLDRQTSACLMMCMPRRWQAKKERR